MKTFLGISARFIQNFSLISPVIFALFNDSKKDRHYLRFITVEIQLLQTIGIIDQPLTIEIVCSFILYIEYYFIVYLNLNFL